MSSNLFSTQSHRSMKTILSLPLAAVAATILGSAAILGATPAFAQSAEGTPAPKATQVSQAAQNVSAATPTNTISEEAALNDGETKSSFTPAQVDIAHLKKNLQYPVKTLAERTSGEINVMIYLDDKGEPVNVNFEAFPPLNSNQANELASAAFKAVKSCKFAPALRNNTPVSSAVRIPFKFIM
jgi:TonB family protein